MYVFFEGRFKNMTPRESKLQNLGTDPSFDTKFPYITASNPLPTILKVCASNKMPKDLENLNVSLSK